MSSSEDRDKELEELQNDLRRPFIHGDEPAERAADKDVCWHNANRLCGADCLAYNRLVPHAAGADRCLILSAVASLADNVEELVQLKTKQASQAIKTQQDAVRTQTGHIPVPPDPRGGSR